ncbi:MAG: ROK family protein [Candidatus Omnitrophica bacterium]|nr:ROK family protein [Candidatus Omnitrophota bacterium]
MIKVAMAKNIYLGIDWGGTFIKLGIFNQKSKLLSNHKISSPNFSKPSKFFKLLKKIIKSELKNKRLSLSQLKGAGIGAPGIIEMKTGRIYYLPNIKGWKNFPFKKIFTKELGIPLALDNDGNIAALAELKRGKAKGIKRGLVLTLGTGLGSGLILNGKVFHGKTSAVEAGHIPLTINGTACGCGAKGCVETFLGNKYFIKKVTSMLKQKGFSLKKFKNLTPLDVYRLALQNNKVAIKAWIHYGYILGLFCRGLVNLLNLEAIVLGGGLSKASRFFMPEMKKTINRQAMHPLNKQVKIYKSKLGDNFGIIGAYELIKTQIK